MLVFYMYTYIGCPCTVFLFVYTIVSVQDNGVIIVYYTLLAVCLSQ